MNDYIKLIQLMDFYGIRMIERMVYDKHGLCVDLSVYLRDANGYMNKDCQYTEKPQYNTYNVNNHCGHYEEFKADEVVDFINKFYDLRKIKDFRNFHDYVKRKKYCIEDRVQKQ